MTSVPAQLAGPKSLAFNGLNITVPLSGAGNIRITNVRGNVSQLGASLLPMQEGSAQLVVTVDGASSAATAVPITPIAPAIFPGGVVNEDNTVNAQASPAPAGSTASIFATGLPIEGGTVWAKIHDRDRLVPSFAGAATGLPGMQRVAVAVPDDLPAMDSEARVCALDANGLPVCSAPVKLTLGPKQ
ncbi:MAG: hypothetical protein M1541_04100 [Acidobacteria bacterium]|nr:hypothetical protein [Acidobacteriota bacterium]